jgi:ankyrin repeat protein/mono/diheme cytochrome c family protein
MSYESQRRAASAGRVLACALAVLSLSTAVSAIDVDHPLFRAARGRDHHLVSSLLSTGTPAELRTEDGTTALMVAALWGDAETVEHLLAHGADAKAANKSGATALLWGAGDIEKVRLLVAAGADVNARSSLGNTPLMAAAAHPGTHPIIELLLEHGADAAARNQNGETALTEAVWTECLESVDLLLAKLETTKQLSKIKESAWDRMLDGAATHGNVALLERLLPHLPDPKLLNGKSKGGSDSQPLQQALLAQKLDAARWLLAHDVDVSGKTRAGKVPTFLLATYFESGEVSIARTLIERGVDVKAKNSRGENALTWARRRGHPELIEILRKAGVPEEADTAPEIPHRNLDLDDGNRDAMVREAISVSVALMQSSSEKFLDKRRNCVSCHHQNFTGIAISLARDRGFEVDQAAVDRMLTRQAKDWGRRVARTHEMTGSVPVPPRFLGWGLWAFSTLGYPRDLITDTYVLYLSRTQRPEGRWTTGMTRPPMGGGDILSTALVVRALRSYSIAGHEEERDARIGRAVEWLHKAEPAQHQETVFRVLGLVWAGVPKDELESDAKTLLAAQRDDGGWAQLEHLPSDAWATGQTLVALHASGQLRARDPAYRRGVDFLLNTRFDDGSWFVKSRTWPFQSHFDSGFPYHHDQWLSIGATAWAVMALALTVEPDEAVTVRSRSEVKPIEREAPAKPAEPKESPAAKKNEPEPAKVDFARDIGPIFSRSCAGCHSGDEPKSGFTVASRDALLRGGDSEVPAISPGAGADSPLVKMISGRVKKLEMPPLRARKKYPALSDDELSKVRAWIDQGAPWPEGANVEPPKKTAVKKT